MNLADLITPDAIRCNIEVNSKKRALEVLADLLTTSTSSEPANSEQSNSEDKPEDPAFQVFQLLIDREKLGSTGMGHGIALPHARTNTTNKASAAFIKLEKGIDFDSPDQQPTDLIFALLVPEHDTEQHLQILSHLASLFSNDTFCQHLRTATTTDELYKHLTHNILSSKAS